MNRFLKILSLLFCISDPLLAQEGDFFVSQFTPSFSQEDQIYFDMLFTSHDELIAANRSGIVRFDGSTWDLIPTPSAPLSVVLGDDLTIYVGCANDFGRIVITDGEFQFESLAPLATDRVLTQQVLIHDQKVYFLQNNRLFEYDPAVSNMHYYDTESTSGGFVYMFSLDGVLWTETITTSYFLGDSLQKGQRILPDEGIVISTATHDESKQIIISSHDGRVYTYTDRFKLIDELTGLSINDLTWVSKDLIALSTLSEGVLFYDLSKKEIQATIDSRNGLPDNEIFAIATDQSAGVWVANTFGFSRIAPLLPIRSFNHYPGLEGNLTTAVYADDTWFLATSDGVYYFDEINNYRNKVYYVPKSTTVKATTSQIPTNRSTTPVNNTSTTTTLKSSGLKSKIGNLFSSSQSQPTTQLKSSTQEKPKLQQLKNNVSKVFQSSTSKAGDLISRIKLPVSDKNKIQYERKVKKELISTQYLYHQIPDIKEKIKQLISFEGAIIAVTPSGIIEIRDQVAEEIFSEPVRYVFHTIGSKDLWISTVNSGVFLLQEIKNVWIESQSITNLSDVILSVYSDQPDNVWMAGTRTLYKVQVTDTSASVVNQYPLDNQFFDNIRIGRINQQLTLVNNQGVFYLDSVDNKIKVQTELMQQIGQIKRHLIQSDGTIWVHDGSNWMRLDADGSISRFTYLKLFPEMSFIDQVDGEIWLINNHQSLYKFKPGVGDSIPSSRMYIREISDEGGLLNTGADQFKISYERNSVYISLARPDYMGLTNVQFAYRLSGLNDEWSDWSSNSQLAFNYLPAGDYTLELRSIDVFGREEYLEPLKIKITPPYWQTTWFSALQVLFFTGLVLIASRLNRSNKESKKLLMLSNILTIVTIVMVIELLQNITESFFGDLGSPVMAFGLDVIVALLIFPVEMLLRRIVTGSAQT